MGFKVVSNTSRVKFSACHFLKEPLKCSRIHGHNYFITVEIKGDLDENYFVVDFLELHKNLNSIVEPLDHYVLIPTESDYLQITEDGESVEVIKSNKRYVFPRSDVKFLPIKATTSELLAKYIHKQLKQFYNDKKLVVKIEESKGNWAIFEE